MTKASTRVTELSVEYSSAEELGAWLSNLVQDITSGKILGFELTTRRSAGCLKGTLELPMPSGLSVAVEVKKEKKEDK